MIQIYNHYDADEIESVKHLKNLMKDNIKKLFKKHIGYENGISQQDVFEKILGIDTDAVTLFQKYYFWDMIKICLREMRSDLTLFVVSVRGRYFVLKTLGEKRIYTKQVDLFIENLAKGKAKATRWVTRKMYEKI